MIKNEKYFLEQLHRKNAAAFKELFDTYYNALVQFACGYVGSQDASEDIVQDVFVDIWEKDYRYPSCQELRSFLYSATHHSCLNFLKRQEMQERHAPAILQALEAPDDIERKIMKEELYRHLYDTIDSLPPKCRQIFLLHLEGKSNKEIAAKLNLTVLTVKTQKKRAMRFLHDKLDEN